MKKLIVALLVVAAMLIIVMPAAAQGPVQGNPFPKSVQMAAGTNEDPFGGLPITGALGVNAIGITAKFGLAPSTTYLPGGVPSNKSGDGSSPRKAIYIGGVWADPSLYSLRTDLGDTQGKSGDLAIELPACATVKIAAGTSKWFKMDTWKTKRLQVWVDDELDGATKASGSSVWGAASKYFYGTNQGDAWSANIYDGNNANELQGYFGIIYDPDNLKPNYYFNPPNALLLTVNVSGSGSLRRSPGADGKGVSTTNMQEGSGPESWMNFNPAEPSHLLWHEGIYNGWVYARIYNQMIWDGTASVCSYRQP